MLPFRMNPATIDFPDRVGEYERYGPPRTQRIGSLGRAVNSVATYYRVPYPHHSILVERTAGGDRLVDNKEGYVLYQPKPGGKGVLEVLAGLDAAKYDKLLIKAVERASM